MSIASEITRLQGVKADILTAIGNKGVTVPAGSALDDCPDLISDIQTGTPEIKEWNLDIPNLDLSADVVDGLPIYKKSNNIEKIDNGTKLRIWDNNEFKISYLQLAYHQFHKFESIEIDIESITKSSYCYIGACAAFIRESFDYASVGAWLGGKSGTANSWTYYAGYSGDASDENPYNFVGRQGISVSYPFTYKLVFGESKISLYYGSVLVAECNNALETYPLTQQRWFDFYMLPYSSGDEIIISRLAVKYK